MRKRLILSGMIAVMIASSVLSGCGKSKSGETISAEQESDMTEGTQKTVQAEVSGKTDENGLPIYDKEVTLLLWGAVPADKGPQEVIDQYNELNKHRNIKIEYYRYSNDDSGNVSLDTSLMAGEKMDMFISYTEGRRDARIQSGKVMDITDICKELDIDLIRDFGESAKGNMIDGKVYSVPTMKYVNVLYYNKDMFDEKGITPPTLGTTWDEIREMAKQLTTDQTYGLFLSPNDDFFGNIIYQTKDEVATPYLSEDKKSTAWKTNPDFRHALQFTYDMMYVDCSLMDWKTMIGEDISGGTKADSLFLNGQTAMRTGGTQVIRNILNVQDFPHEFKTGFAPIPKMNDSQEEYYAAIGPNDHIAVNINCEYPEEAVRYIKWYAEDGYDPMIKNGRLPLSLNYDVDKAVELIVGDKGDYIDVESLKEAAFGDYTHTNIPVDDPNRMAMTKIYKEEADAYFLDQQDLDTMLANLEKRCNEILK